MLNVTTNQTDQRTVDVYVNKNIYHINVHFFNSDKLVNICKNNGVCKCYHGWQNALNQSFSRKTKIAICRAREILENYDN